MDAHPATPNLPDIPDDFAMAIQRAAEQHYAKVWEAYYDQEDAEDGEEVLSPAVGPFCGCERCVVREILAGAWPAIEVYFALR